MFRYISMVALLFCSCRVYSEDFQITQIKSSNVLYRYWATRHLHKKGNNIITISFEDSLAYVSYKVKIGECCSSSHPTDVIHIIRTSMG